MISSDLHLRWSVPVCRGETQVEWIEFQRNCLRLLVDTANEYNEDLYIAGDIFHSSKASIFSSFLVQLFITEISRLNGTCYIMPGNHDKEFHASTDRNAYGLLEKTMLVSHKIRPISDVQRCVPFGGELEGTGNIVFEHVLTFESEKEVPHGVRVFETAESLVKKYPDAEYIVVGDMHRSWVKKIGTTTVINCGCMSPQSKTELTYPCVFYSIENEKLFEYPSDIKVRTDILDSLSDNTEDTLDLATLVELAKKQDGSDIEVLDFSKNCANFLTTHEIDDIVGTIITKWLEEATHE